MFINTRTNMDSNQKTEIILSLPRIDELVSVTCQIKCDKFKETLNPFNYQVLICRLIISTVRCCLGSPDPDFQDLIQVIISQKFFNTGRMQKVLERLEVSYLQPTQVEDGLYDRCLKYTFTFKLAPYWNLVAKDFYLRGFDFLMHSGTLDAVSWDIFSKSSYPKITIHPMTVKVLPLLLTDLPVPALIIDNFLNNPHCTNTNINLMLFGEIIAYVLPSLKKARLLSVYKIRPQSCPFGSYGDLRSHWKNMYSYRLPKNETSMLYYEVAFPRFPERKFIYPDVCLRADDLKQTHCRGQTNEIATQFAKDLTMTIHSVCGSPTSFSHVFPSLIIKYSETRVVDVIRDANPQALQSKSKPPPVVIPANLQPDLSKVFPKKRKMMQLPLHAFPSNAQTKKFVRNTNQFLSYYDLEKEDSKVCNYEDLQQKSEYLSIDQDLHHRFLTNISSNLNDNTILWNGFSQTDRNFDRQEKVVILNSELTYDSSQMVSNLDQVPSRLMIKSVENVQLDVNRLKKLKPQNKISSKPFKTCDDLIDPPLKQQKLDFDLSPLILERRKKLPKLRTDSFEFSVDSAKLAASAEFWKNESVNEIQSSQAKIDETSLVIQRFKEIGPNIFRDSSQADECFDKFKQILKQCTQENVEATLVLSPLKPETQVKRVIHESQERSEALMFDTISTDFTNSQINLENCGFYEEAIRESESL